MRNKLFALLMAMAMVFSLATTALADGNDQIVAAGEGSVTVLYTNDVHTYINKDLTYSMIASYRNSLDNVLLVDAGDHIQGTAYGGMDNGATIIKLMNAVGYDLATLGNHEFDYGMEECLKAVDAANFPYVSCNFYHEANGQVGSSVLDSYKVFEVNGVKIAFIGITTPESFTKSTPAYFQDGNGNYIYGIAGGNDGAALYASVQKAIDAAAQEADVVIALGHLGDDASSKPWTSEEVIANTTGLDAFIDGHSHSTVPMKNVTDKNGDTVVLTQTGSYLDNLGEMTITVSDNGAVITTKLLTIADMSDITPDATVKAMEDEWIGKVDEMLGEKVASSEIDFTINFPSSEERAVRMAETNLGDFNADAYYWYSNEVAGLDCDVAIMNGGGIRANAAAGDWSYLTMKTVNTFGNVLCVVEVDGQAILDALEFGARFVGEGENGGFLQVAGLTYEINTAVENTIKEDDKGVWLEGPSKYRVTNVRVYNKETGAYEALELDKTYTLAGTNYTLLNCGDGFNMFGDAKKVLDGTAEDYLAMAAYAKAFADTDGDNLANIATANSPLASYEGYLMNYEEAAGAGRITVVNNPVFSDVNYSAWYGPAVEYVSSAGIMTGVGGNLFNPAGAVTRGTFMTMLARYAGVDTSASNPWYQVGMDWAVENKVSDGTYQELSITREQLVTMLYRYMEEPEEGADLSSFSDASSVSDWAKAAMEWAVLTEVIQGTGTGLNPRGTATRMEIAQIMMNFCEGIKG